MSKKSVVELAPWELKVGKSLVVVAAIAAIGDLVMYLAHTLFGWVWVLVAICLVAAGLYFGRRIKKEGNMPRIFPVVQSIFTQISNLEQSFRDAIILIRSLRPSDGFVAIRYRDSYVLVCWDQGVLEYAFVGKQDVKNFGVTIKHSAWKTLQLVAGPQQTVAAGVVFQQHAHNASLLQTHNHVFHRDRVPVVPGADDNLRSAHVFAVQSITAPKLMHSDGFEHIAEITEAVECGIGILCGVIVADDMPKYLTCVYSSPTVHEVMEIDDITFAFKGAEAVVVPVIGNAQEVGDTVQVGQGGKSDTQNATKDAPAKSSKAENRRQKNIAKALEIHSLTEEEWNSFTKPKQSLLLKSAILQMRTDRLKASQLKRFSQVASIGDLAQQASQADNTNSSNTAMQLEADCDGAVDNDPTIDDVVAAVQTLEVAELIGSNVSGADSGEADGSVSELTDNQSADNYLAVDNC